MDLVKDAKLFARGFSAAGDGPVAHDVSFALDAVELPSFKGLTTNGEALECDALLRCVDDDSFPEPTPPVSESRDRLKSCDDGLIRA